jgi:hypothetical protein
MVGGGRRGAEEMVGREEEMLRRTWAPAIANGQISHGQHRYPIATANAGRPFVTGARDGRSDYKTHPVFANIHI